MFGLDRNNLRHLATFLRLGNRPATSVYDSIGSDFFLAPAPHWLNVGLWEGNGEESEAPQAVRRLVETLASALPQDGVIVDVGNGLGAQDPVISTIARPKRLVAINITPSQLNAGRAHLNEAGALPLVADAVALPMRAEAADGVICVEAAFHFSSRPKFFRESFRTLSPGGTISMSDFIVSRRPRTLRERFMCLVAIRVWGVRTDAVVSEEELRHQAEGAGFRDVDIRACGDKTIDPALALFRERLRSGPRAPWTHRAVAAAVLGQWTKLRQVGIMEYVLLTAKKPDAAFLLYRRKASSAGGSRNP